MKVVATPGNIYHVEGWTNADHQRYTTGIADSLFSVTAPPDVPNLEPTHTDRCQRHARHG